ncbi:unnamed protein product [Cyprideis torosa]|uniref:SREBP regulating gene protein n=1 Tax=Cyprideis torosa TaxID=163714 RepID=A0A7R8ZNC9_9CRUS|nr:unnamed protein product [Cyprideis torosa]CAG0896000.1 unnamed protein product [Cyprideis torosa]
MDLDDYHFHPRYLEDPDHRHTSTFFLILLACGRFLRKKVVLGAIFSFSLIYCLYNLSVNSSAGPRFMRSPIEEPLPPMRLPENFRWALNGEEDAGPPEEHSYASQTVLPLPPPVNGSMGDGDPPVGAGAEQIGGKRSLMSTCRNSVQGKELIADDRGFLCLRRNLLPSGCCNSHVVETQRFACSECNLENHCCPFYEQCISCCLDPKKRPILQALVDNVKDHREGIIYSSVSDHFELCLAKCRTSSSSVKQENIYRNPKTKHCYGPSQASSVAVDRARLREA